MSSSVNESGIQKVGVAGAGTMGLGIAQLAATHGCSVKLYDLNAQALDKAKAAISKSLEKLSLKEKISESPKNILERIDFVQSLDALAEVELFIEAILEDFDIKTELLTQFESLASEKAIIASNTSSLSITGLAARLQRPERFCGIHFFNPAVLMKLVEVISALQTAPEVIDQLMTLISNDWKKVAVRVKNSPGFIVNKVARPFYGEALFMLDHQIASKEAIDQAMMEFGGFRMGPFELMDFIGNDVNYAVTESVYNAFYQEARYRPSLTQKSLVEAGYLGRKSGRGYYDYQTDSENTASSLTASEGKRIAERIRIMIINEAADTLELGIASRDDIDLSMQFGVNYPGGPFRWADEYSIAYCVEKLDALFDEFRDPRYRCSPLLRNMLRSQRTFYSNATQAKMA
jgi:3-hydroxybutyryl-CoA dehydrogenase